MNINGLGSVSWYTNLRSTSSSSSSSNQSTSSTDSADISASGFAALLQSQGGGGPPEMTDEMASQIGATLKEKNADLFSALDSDGNGTLSANELKTGMDAMRGGGGKGRPPELTDEKASQIGASLKEENADLFSALDTDGDGTLSASELKAGMDAMHGHKGGPPQVSDEMAAKISAKMKEDDPDLFTSLDTDGDGTVTAKELKAGQDAMHEAMAANGMGPPPPPPEDGTSSSSDGTGSDQLSQLFGSTGSTNMSDFKSNLMSEILQSMFAQQES